MADDPTPGGSAASFRCPWCSAALPSTALETCPSCGATLTSAPDAALPGVTSIDHEAILRATRDQPRPQRSRLLSWLSGDYVDEGTSTPGAPEAILPPDAAVKREILRLEIEAELADRQAEADSLMADAAVEGRSMPGVDEGEPVNGAGLLAEDVVAAGSLPDPIDAQTAPAPLTAADTVDGPTRLDRGPSA